MDENTKDGDFKLTPKDVKRWKEFSRIQTNQETYLFLKNIFGDFLDLFYNQEAKKDNEKYRHLATNFLELVLDPGLNRQITLFDEALNPVLMLKRMGGISWLKEKINLEERIVDDKVNYLVNNDNFSILRLDIANAFGANQVEKNKGGDYLLNKVASAINKVIDSLKSELDQKKIEILPARYGGDEFVVFVTGQLTQEQIEMIYGKITNQEAFFGENAEKRKISLKGDKIEVIDPQQITDSLKKQLFYSFLNRGVILSPEELEIEYQRISKRKGGVESYINEAAAKDIYPKEIEEITDEKEKIKRKINYLLEIHPEFKLPFYLAWYLDQKDNLLAIDRQKTMLKVIENYLIDPLLDRMVISRFDLEDHIKRNGIKEMLAFELKLKEVNEDKDLGYGYSDLLIVETWRQLKRVLGEELVNKLKIMRFGGMINLCISEGLNITQEQKDKLKKLQISLNGVTHDVGFASIQFEGDNSQAEKIKEKIQQVFTEPDFDWLRKRIDFTLSNEQIYNLFIEKLKEGINREEVKLEDKDMEKQLELFLLYLLGEKRGKARRENLRKVLEDLREKETDERTQEILNILKKFR